jgi:hypothetical protein
MRTTLRSLCILRLLCRAGMPVGEPFVQNGLFLLQEAMGEKLDCGFYLDRFGPRSRDVFENLLALEEEGKITIAGSPEGLLIEVTQSGKDFVNRGGEWGAFFDLPPVRIPGERIDAIFTLISGDAPVRMESFGTALFFALTAGGHDDFMVELSIAKSEKKLAEDISSRSIIEAFRRLKRLGIRFTREEL